MVHLNIIIQHRHQSSTFFFNGASTMLNNVIKIVDEICMGLPTIQRTQPPKNGHPKWWFANMKNRNHIFAQLAIFAWIIQVGPEKKEWHIVYMYFPHYVNAITGISVWGNFSWEKRYQDQQFLFRSLFSRAQFVRQCRGPSFPFSAWTGCEWIQFRLATVVSSDPFNFVNALS